MKSVLYLLAVGAYWLLDIIRNLPEQLPLTIGAFLAPKVKWNGVTLKERSYNYWLAQDQKVNAFIFGGNPDVTVSSKVGYLSASGDKTAKGMEYFIDFLFYVAVGQKNHCRESIEWDEKHSDF